LYLTKLQRKNEIIRSEERPYYINDIILSRFGLYGSVRDAIPGHVETVVNRVALGGFLWLLWFPLPIPVLLIAPYLLIILGEFHGDSMECSRWEESEGRVSGAQKRYYSYLSKGVNLMQNLESSSKLAGWA
jgi:hypothetical protein